jgi:hypothetical protein
MIAKHDLMGARVSYRDWSDVRKTVAHPMLNNRNIISLLAESSIENLNEWALPTF